MQACAGPLLVEVYNSMVRRYRCTIMIHYDLVLDGCILLTCNSRAWKSKDTSNGGRTKWTQNSAKRTQKRANERKTEICSIGCLTLAIFWQLCFASYHVDGIAQSTASQDVLVITMPELHAWTNHELHAWKLITPMALQHFSDRSTVSVDHASPCKDTETTIYFRGSWAYMSAT